MKVRENMGPLSPYISQTIGNLGIRLDAKVMKNYELSNDKKISTPFISVILRVQFLHTFSHDIWDKYSCENFSYTKVPVLR